MLGELLLDGAAALDAAVGALGEIFAEGADDAPVIDGAVLVEAAVLRGHDGLAHRVGDLVGGEDNAVLDEDAAELLAIDVVEGGGDVKIVELLEINLLSLGGVVEGFFVDEVSADSAQAMRKMTKEI